MSIECQDRDFPPLVWTKQLRGHHLVVPPSLASLPHSSSHLTGQPTPQLLSPHWPAYPTASLTALPSPLTRQLGLHHLLVTDANVPILGVITRQDLMLVRGKPRPLAYE